MFFSKKYKIVVTNPCQENWEKMLPQEKGRFCNSCAKSVVDYANMSDKEINERMRNATSHMCGRFTKEQLDKTFTMRPKVQLSAQRRFFKYILTFLLGSKAFINKAMGQDTLKTEQTDSLKLAAINDSTIADTVALAIEDTANLHTDSLVLNYEWPEGICTSDIFITTEVITMISGDFYPGVVINEGPTFIPRIFDTIRNVVGVTPSNKKEITLQEDTIPEKQKRKPPLKKQEPITAVLPSEIKSEWDESKAE